MDLLNRLPFAGTVKSPVSEKPRDGYRDLENQTSSSDQENALECSTCWIFCPDACITRTDDGMVFNLKYCKGCAICEAVCPSEAISMVPELDFKD